MSKLTVSTVINAPIETVWDAMWNPIHIVHWGFADAATWHCPWAKWDEPKVGWIFTTRMEARDGSFGFDLTAQYTEVTPMKSMSYTLGEMKEYFLDAGRVVDITLTPTSPQPSPQGEGVMVPFTFSEGEGARGWGGEVVLITQTFDAEDINSTEQQIQGWRMILENFRKYVESL